MQKILPDSEHEVQELQISNTEFFDDFAFFPQ